MDGWPHGSEPCTLPGCATHRLRKPLNHITSFLQDKNCPHINDKNYLVYLYPISNILHALQTINHLLMIEYLDLAQQNYL